MALVSLGLYLIMLVVLFVVRSLLQKRSTGDSGIRYGSLKAAIGSAEWLAGWLLVLATICGVAAPVLEILGLEPLTSNLWVRSIGIVVTVSGIAIAFFSQLDMGKDWRIGVDTNERTGLVTNGMFSVVRNPIFSAMILAASGFTLIVTNPISLLGFVGLVAAIQLQVRYVEEPHLRHIHSKDYKVYTSQVGRFFPGIGKN